MSAAPLLLRADASASMGLGHAVRSLALGEALLDAGGGPVRWLTAEPLAALVERAERVGIEVQALRAAPGSPADARETADAADPGTWIVLDGYHFDAVFGSSLIAHDRRVLVVDDHGHAGSYDADLVLNQNARSDRLYARRAPRTRLLLGPRYALLRRAFRDHRTPRASPPARASRVVVTMGGSDPAGVSGVVLDALADVPGPLEIAVIAGSANPRAERLREAAARSPHPTAVRVDVRDMVDLLAWSDLAVSAAGGTSWELARVGTPQLSIVVAENQRPVAETLAAAGAAVDLGWYASLDRARLAETITAVVEDARWRASLSHRGAELVDGRGAERVLTEMGLLRSRLEAVA